MVRDVLWIFRIDDNDIGTTRSNQNEIWMWNFVIFTAYSVDFVRNKGNRSIEFADGIDHHG